jgi:hypothetical protein
VDIAGDKGPAGAGIRVYLHNAIHRHSRWLGACGSHTSHQTKRAPRSKTPAPLYPFRAAV